MLSSLVFVGDESVDLPVLQKLSELGHRVIVIAHQAPGISDLEVLEIARAHDAILITSDKDFGELVVKQKQRCRGVVLLRLFDLDPATMAARVVAAFHDHGPEWEGAFTVVNPRQIRIRPLPGPGT